MDYLLYNTLQVLAIADWAWQARLNTLLVRTISLVVESRALSVDVARLVDTWHKRYWNAFLARLRRQALEMEYMEEHLSASGQPSWHVLQTTQFRSYRLLHLTVQCANHRDCDRLIQLWRSRAQRAHFGRFRLYTYIEQTAADDSFSRMLVDGQHFAFDSQEWRPPWPPARLWFQLPSTLVPSAVCHPMQAVFTAQNAWLPCRSDCAGTLTCGTNNRACPTVVAPQCSLMPAQHCRLAHCRVARRGALPSR